MKMFRAITFTIKTFWKAARPIFLVCIITSVFIALSSIVNTITFKEIIDSANNQKTLLGLSIFGVIIFRLVYELIKKIVEGMSNYFAVLLDISQVIFMHRSFVDKISTLDISTFENPSSVGLINRAFGRLQFQMKLYVRAIIDLLASIIELSVSIVIFFIASPILAIIIIIANIIPIIVRSKYANGVFMIYRADDETRRKFGYTSNVLMERETLPEVKIYRAFDFFKQRLTEIFKIFTGNQLKLEKKYQVFNTISEFIPILSVFIFSMYIANQLLTNSISTGTFVFLFTNVFVFSGALGRLGQNLGHLYADSHFIDEVREFFELKPNVTFPQLTNPTKTTLIERLKNPTFIFENVSFAYPNSEKNVLHKINLTIPYGQNLALIGENGAGKTTLVKLLLRMYDPTEGKILVNGVNLKELPEDILFSLYSTLFQSFGKFYLTVKENLELAAGRKLSEQEMEEYLKFSNAWEFIKTTKHKFNQQLGPEYKEGTDLSGGQWQRLAIARAYAKDAPMLILDEPTSAVDARSEMEIFDRLNKEMKVNTLLFISHRFSTIKDAERIVVLHQGKIVEDGTHSNLMANKGKYFDLYTIQAERYKRS
jgi:ATP-binding cassette subfamily B protein